MKVLAPTVIRRLIPCSHSILRQPSVGSYGVAMEGGCGVCSG
jgi:hypothetical protein